MAGYNLAECAGEASASGLNAWSIGFAAAASLARGDKGVISMAVSIAREWGAHRYRPSTPCPCVARNLADHAPIVDRGA